MLTRALASVLPVGLASALTWTTCVLLPAWPSDAGAGSLLVSASAIGPAIAGAFLLPRRLPTARMLLLFVAPIALFAAVLAFDLGPGLVWSLPASMLATASFLAYVAVAIAAIDAARPTRPRTESAHRERGLEETTLRAGRRLAFVAWIATLGYALVAVAPAMHDASESEARWGAKTAEGRVLATIFGLAIAVFLSLGLAVPAQRKVRDRGPTPVARFGIAFGYAACAALAYVLLRSR